MDTCPRGTLARPSECGNRYCRYFSVLESRCMFSQPQYSDSVAIGVRSSAVEALLSYHRTGKALKLAFETS
jgi:hypothetical protein